jgi:hypothetical protein
MELEKQWCTTDLSLSELKSTKLIKHANTFNPWINYYHNGIPAYRIEKSIAYEDYRDGLSFNNFLKFNIFCFRKDVLDTIVPSNYQLPIRADWEYIQPMIKEYFIRNHDGISTSRYLAFNNILDQGSSDFFYKKPDKRHFINDFEKSVVFAPFTNILLENENLYFLDLIDIVGYPSFSIRLIQNPGSDFKQIE